MHKVTKEMLKIIGASQFYKGQSTSDMLGLLSGDYLSKVGWIESAECGYPVRDGLPIPWITYAALDYLENHVATTDKILEFGAGFSTLFWALRGNEILYLETDQKWDLAISSVIANLGDSYQSRVNSMFSDILFQEKNARFEICKVAANEECVSIEDLPQEISEYFINQIINADLITIDGILRNYFLQLVSETDFTGTIVLDNSERPEYKKGIEFIEVRGWRRIDFSGLGPINPYGWTTSVFRRPE